MNTPVAVPPRPQKPRATGRTQVLDTGIGTQALADILEVAGPFIDLAKLGWGTGVIVANLEAKLDLYRSHDIDVCFGGTLLELAYLQDRMADLVAWLRELAVLSVEVSDGTVVMPESDKLGLIEELASEFTVYSEVGSKDADAIVSPARWVRAIRSELRAGASYVILEGRESGTAGLYRPAGEIRTGLIDEIIESGIDVDRLVFEAPVKTHQVWLLKHFGADINLGNIALPDVIPLETLRLGLRGDTLLRFHGPDAPR